MKSLQNLREQRAAKAAEVRNLLDSTVTNWTKDTEGKVDAILAEVDNLDGQISRFEKALTIENSLEARARQMSEENGRSVDENAHTVNRARLAFNAYLRGGVENLSDEERALVQPVNASGRASARNVAVGGGATAGVTVPTIIMPNAIAALKAFGGMRQVASQISTSSGGPLDWPTYDDTSAEGEIVGEAVAAADDDVDSFGTATIGAYKFSSKVVPVSIEILQDSAIDIEQVVTNALFQRIARGQNRYFTTGTGSSQPKGVVTAAAAGVTGSTTGGVTYDELVDLVHSIDPAYRIQGASFMFNDSTLKIVKKLKDSDGRPLWLPSTAAAIGGAKDPDTILGYGYTINQHMASMAANAKSILFGAFGKYLIRDVMQMQLFRFTDSAYAKKGQVGFLVWARADGNLVDATANSIKRFTNAAS